MRQNKFTKAIMLLMTAVLSLSPISVLAAPETTDSTQAVQSQKTTQTSEELLTESPELTGTEPDAPTETDEQEEVTIDHLGQTISLPKETDEVADAGFYNPPVITEENQSGLGDSLKPMTRSARSTPFINWDQSSLPRTDFIDVSSHQSNISVAQYNNLKKYGVTGVVVKLTEGTTYRNPNAKNQITNAKAAGLKVSVYHYSWFKNKKSAEAEADYFVKFAKELGLGSDTIMVNDIEEPDTKTKYATANSIYFAQRLIAKHGIKRVVHYASLSWFNEGVLNVQQLGGGGSIWVAQYPYTPSNSNLQNQDKAAWQWSSTMRFPGEGRHLDVSIDYNGLFSNRKTLNPEGPYIPFNQYVSITKKGYSTWSNFNWKKRSDSSKLLRQTFLAKGKYIHANGSTYYSLYDAQGKWHGYINSGATKHTGDQGDYIPYNKYVKVASKNYSVWSNFNWKKRGSSSALYNKTLLAKGQYNHFSGSVYYSLYDTAGNWKGYINRSATKAAANEGPYIPFNKYVSITSKTHTVWANFSWKKHSDSSKLFQTTLLAKGKYQYTNGRVYYSLYDSKGKWHGYINSNATRITGDQGAYIPFNKSVKITSNNYDLWANFNWKKKGTSSGIYNQNLVAKGKYLHFNGAVYYSLYDARGNWKGYINSRGTNLK